jgi:hypothetical protein
MTQQARTQRSAWFVPIIVALITATGALAAAWINANGGFPWQSSTPAGPGATPPTSEQMPDIAGNYHLDPDNPRVIVITRVGDDFTVEEQLPASWPFKATVSWLGGATFSGEGSFASGDRLRVDITRRNSGLLDTEFVFLSDPGRVDAHTLVPLD